MSDVDRIKEIEDEIQKTPYNKATSHHIGKLKAKLARLKETVESHKGIGIGGKSFGIPKSGHATVALVGHPSVGKSTLLQAITNSKSEIADYDFTTLDVQPGMLAYRGAMIQILDLPGLVEGAARGKGRGKEVLAVIRAADLVVLMASAVKFEIDDILAEVQAAAIRLNRQPPQIVISYKERGGIDIQSTVKQTHLDEDTIKAIILELGVHSAVVILRQNVTDQDLIDAVKANCAYIPAILVINKVELVDAQTRRKFKQRYGNLRIVETSLTKGKGKAELLDAIFESLQLIRIYLQPRGGEPDFEQPLILRNGQDLRAVCKKLHRDLERKFRYANVWGKSAKFAGQTVGLDHQLQDEDIVTLITAR